MGSGFMRRKFILGAGLVFIFGLAAISTKYLPSTHKNGPLLSQAFIHEPYKMERVTIKKHFGNTVLIIDAAILKPRIVMPASFLTMIFSDDTQYSLRLRDVRFHLSDNVKDLLIEGPEALSNKEFTDLAIRNQSILSNKGYDIDPNAELIHIKISGNKVKVFS